MASRQRLATHKLGRVLAAASAALLLAACQAAPTSAPGTALSMGDRAEGETGTGYPHFGARAPGRGRDGGGPSGGGNT